VIGQPRALSAGHSAAGSHQGFHAQGHQAADAIDEACSPRCEAWSRVAPRLLPSDNDFRLSQAPRQAVSADRTKDLTALAVVACTGTIVTGAVDPLADVVPVAREGSFAPCRRRTACPRRWSSPRSFRAAKVDSLSIDALLEWNSVQAQI
jgi:hypothetical protein